MRIMPCVLLCCGLLVVGPPAVGQGVDELIDEAMNDYSAGRADLAISHLKKALSESPSHDGVLYRLCLLTMQEHHDDEAVAYCQKLYDLNPRDQSYQLNRWLSRSGRFISEMQRGVSARDFQRAVRAGKLLLAIDNDIPKAHVLLGGIYVYRDTGAQDRQLAVGHFQEALRLQEALSSDSPLALESADLAELQTGLGITYLRSQDYAQAVRCFEAALQLDPSIPDGQYNLDLARQGLRDGRGRNVEWKSLADLLGIP